MPRRNRTFTSEDVLRIIDEHLSSVEAAAVVAELRFGPMRRMMEAGTGMDEEDFRQLNRFANTLKTIKGNR